MMSSEDTCKSWGKEKKKSVGIIIPRDRRKCQSYYQLGGTQTFVECRGRPRQYKDFVLLCNLVKTLFPLSNHQTSIITVVACKTCALTLFKRSTKPALARAHVF